ncbi:hypothetical protein K9L16_01760 [Candidatus Pacearchaeota archaeon]|nr:hypothetical protein [Candidatus Pacearchaeota archaeon]
MSNENFQQRKKDILFKADKSFIGKWDKKIKKLCDKINSLENYYTTSSCSGRVVVIVDSDKKTSGLFFKVWHEKVSLREFLDVLNKSSRINSNEKLLNLKFKQEPVILHVACLNLESADKLMKLAQKAGFKKIGIIAMSKKSKRIVVEISGSEKIEFPLVENGKLLVNENFLKHVIARANKNLERGWKLIESVEKRLSSKY